MDPTPDQQPPELPPPVAQDDSLRFFVYVVQPKDALRDLCVSTLGRYDKAVRSQVQELNPELKNTNHLEPGQKIRLPLNAPN